MKAIANHVFALNFPHATLQSKRGGARNVLAAAKRRSCTVAVFAGHACALDLVFGLGFGIGLGPFLS